MAINKDASSLRREMRASARERQDKAAHKFYACVAPHSRFPPPPLQTQPCPAPVGLNGRRIIIYWDRGSDRFKQF